MIPELNVTGAAALRDGAAAAPTVHAIHDLGNLIQVASSGMNILARNPNVIAAPDVLEVVGGARIALERAGALIRSTIARGNERQRRAGDVSVEACLAEIQGLVAIAWNSGVRLEAEAVGLEPTPMVEFRVTDAGIGMTPDTVVRAFEPFFTTKGTGLGGVGLPSVKRFSDEHGGSIAIRSVLGSGTTVTLRLPAARG